MITQPGELFGVGILVFNGSKVLLVKHGEAAGHMTGTYGIPAGRLNVGEELIDAAIREFNEETGLIADKDSMILISETFEGDIERKGGKIVHAYLSAFVAKNYSGQLQASNETTPEWVEISEISQFNLLPNVEKAIQEGLKI